MRRIDIYLFVVIIVYIIVCMINIFVYRFTEHSEYIQMVLMIVAGLPIFVKPLHDWMRREL